MCVCVLIYPGTLMIYSLLSTLAAAAATAVDVSPADAVYADDDGDSVLWPIIRHFTFKLDKTLSTFCPWLFVSLSVRSFVHLSVCLSMCVCIRIYACIFRFIPSATAVAAFSSLIILCTIKSLLSSFFVTVYVGFDATASLYCLVKISTHIFVVD